MTKEKNTIRTELLFDNNGESKLKLSVEWDKNKKKACVIMLRFGKGDGIYFDKSTNQCVKNLSSMDYGGFDIVNLFSSSDMEMNDTNIDTIKNAVAVADTVVYAVGVGKKNYKAFQPAQSLILPIIESVREKLFCISDSDGNGFYHPLCPKVDTWHLTKFNTKDLLSL